MAAWPAGSSRGWVLRLIIAGSNPIFDNIKTLLSDEGYKVLGEALDGFDAIKLCKQHKPDVIIIEKNLELLDGISVAKILQNEDLDVSVVFFAEKMDKDTIEKLKKVGVKGIITNPIIKENLLATIELSSYIGSSFREIIKEKELISKKFEDRKVIDKAKGILMINESLTEDESYSRIRKYSMEKRVTMREIAEFIIVSNDFK